jgi:predicted ATPase
MYLRRIRISNFKSFEDVSFEFNSDVNILTGLNNSGKTTVLEAVSLWAECFRILIQQESSEKKRGKKRAISVKPSDYFLGTNGKNYFSSSDIFSVRTPDASSLFRKFDTGNPIHLAGVVVADDKSEMNIEFVINWSRGDRLEINIHDFKSFDHQKLNVFFRGLPDALNIVYASPIAVIAQKEEFLTRARVKKYINERQSALAIRNRLYTIYNSGTQSWQDFLDSLSYILYDKQKKILFDFSSDRNNDVEAIVGIQVQPSDPSIDLSMVGSGTLQIIEILLALYSEQFDLNIILMDEPDSHIHRDIQKRLLEVLTQRSVNNQLILTTHNESLIRSSKAQYLFHLDGSTTSYKTVIRQSPKFQNYQGFQPGYHIKILESLGSESALEILNAVEADKIILVEGYSDAKYIDAILSTQYVNKQFNVMYWSFQGITKLLYKLEAYKEIFGLIKNKRSLWDKTVAVIDKDFLLKDQSQKLVQQLEDKYDLNVFSWSSRTFEGTLLSEPKKYFQLLSAYATDHIENGDINLISATFQKEIPNLKSRMLSYLKERHDKGELSKQIKSIRDICLSIGVDRKVFTGNDDSWAPLFVKEVEAELNANSLSIIANKEDVSQLTRSILIECGMVNISDDISDYLADMIRIGKHVRFQEWNDLVRIIEK